MNQWNLSGTAAKWANNSATVAGDLAEPDKGLNVQTPDCVTHSTLNLFGISWCSAPSTTPPSPRHHTVCGTTLRSTFPESASFPVETQITWTVLDHETALLGLDVIVTIGTQELDTHPQIVLCSRIADAVTLKPNSSDRPGNHRNSYTLCRPHNTNLTYVEMVHPATPHSRQVSRDDGTGCTLLQNTLFACPLEKGVILRASLRGLLLRRNGDEAAAAACFAQFCNVAPPLGR